MRYLALVLALTASACGMDGGPGDIDPSSAPACTVEVTTFACPGQPSYVRTCRAVANGLSLAVSACVTGTGDARAYCIDACQL